MSRPNLTIAAIKSKLDAAQLAGFIYQHNNHMLMLQEALNEAGSIFPSFVQHEHSTDQIGMQFGLRLSQYDCKILKLEFLIGITHSNQDRSYEIGIGHLKGDEQAFNLSYAFYNYPKAFFMVSCPLYTTSAQLQSEIEQQIFNQAKLDFLNTAMKTSPLGEQVTWMKDFIFQQALDMKVRIQRALR